MKDGEPCTSRGVSTVLEGVTPRPRTKGSMAWRFLPYELYTMQRYLQYDRLQELGMAHFDCWASRFGETVTALELAPEGTGYRARTRFSKFFNLPELMNLFKEVADIKTADQLHLPTPEVEYHNIVAQPTEQQQEMVKALSDRASLVHSGTVDPSQDNMLKITSDGRKLGLDQRIINQLLPDEPGTKVNQCVDNIMQIWRDGEADKLTQLVFCDISTPQARPAKKVAKALDNPTLHALEDAVPLDEPEPAFTVYEDIRQKLIAKGVPAEQIAFIHEANTEVRKKELFSKVRTGQVRVLLGSTAKMGAGTNVQDRLWRCMTWTARGGPATWPSERAALSAKATRTRLSMCTATSPRALSTPTSGRRWRTSRNSSARL